MQSLREPLNIDLVTYAELMDTELSTEGIPIIRNIPEYLTTRISSVVDSFVAEYESLKNGKDVTSNIYYKDLYKNKLLLRKRLSSIDYSIVKRRKTAITVGLDVDIMILCKILTDSNRLVANNIDDILTDTKNVIAKLVSDKEFRRSTRPMVIDKRYAKVVDTLNSNLTTIITPTNTGDVIEVSKLAPTIPHIEEAIDLALGYAGNNSLDNYTRLLNSVTIIKNYSETLYQVFKDEEVNATKTRIKEVSTYLQVAANFITQSVNTMYMTTQSVIMINNLVKIVIK